MGISKVTLPNKHLQLLKKMYKCSLRKTDKEKRGGKKKKKEYLDTEIS